MQLKSLAKTQDALIDIDNLKNAANEIEALTNIGQSYTTETLKSALAQSTLDKEQIKTILSANGLQGELLETTADEVANAASTNAVAASQATTTTTTLGLGTAFQGLSIKIKQATASMRAFMASNPITMLIAGIAAVVTATYGAIKASDAWLNRTKKNAEKSTEAYNDMRSQIDELNAELKTNSDRIDELNAKEHLTLIESEELQKLKESNRELENQIALKQKLAETELREAREETLKYFNEGGGWVGNKETHDTEWADRIDFVKYQLEELKKVQEKINEAEKEIALIDTSTTQGKSLYKQKKTELDALRKDYDIFLEKVQDSNDTFSKLDDNLIKGKDDEIINRLQEFYNLLNETLTGVAQTHTDTISATLAKADFQSTSKQLEELGKSGELSVATLSSRFPELIEYLDQAGISAEELYQYIMALSNPDAIKYDEVEKQFKTSLGMRDGEINGASDQKIQDKIDSSFDNYEREIVLDAYLKVRDQYGDHPEGWTVDDWISNIQAELEDKNVEVEANISFDQAWADSFTSEDDKVKELGDSLLELAEKGRLTVDTFNEADSTEYFKNLGISAEEAVSKINKLVDESKQLSSMSDQISKMSEALGAKQENGFVDADTLAGFDVEVRGLESWDRFQEVLGSTTSSYEECQKAANELATEWVNSSDFLAQLTEQNKEYYETQLENMGIENYEEVIENTLALKEAKEALIDVNLADASYEDIEALIEEGEYFPLVTEQIWALYYAKLAESNIFLDSSSDCAQLQALANDAMLTAEAVELLNQLMQIYNGLENGAYNGNRQLRTEAVEEAERIKKELENLAKGEGEGLIAKPQLKLNTGSGKKSGSGSGSKSKTKEEKDTTKEYDWIEQAIENVEKEIKELDEVADSSYSTFSQKNEALTKEIGKVTEEIELQQKAYEEYMRKADSIGLPDSYKELVQNGAINIEDIKDEKLQEQIEGYQKWYDKAQNASDAIKELKTDLKDLHVESYKLQTENLKDRLDSDSITEKQYLAGLKSAYEQFYGNVEEYAEQYHEAKLEYLEEEKKYLNSVANAAASLLDVEIDRIQENADEQEEQLKGQIELLEARKKPLQDELEALDDKVRKEGLALNLQKAQYDLARAENQRSKLIYTADKGMIYTNDTKAIRDAEKDVDDAKLEIHKQSIQDQIDVLDDEISRYDELIDQINKAADAQVKALEKIKNKWQEVIDQQEYAKNVTILTGEFGSDAIVKILSGNDDDLLAQWKNSYINTLKSIDSESQGYIGDMTKQIESLYKNQASAVTNVVSNANNTVDKSVNTIKGEITLPDGTVIRPIEPGDRAWELQKAFEPLVNKILNGETDIVNSALFEHQRQMEQWTKNLTYSNVMNNVTNNKNMQPVINIGDITVQGVQDVNGFARAVKAYFPNTMLQEMHKR